MKKEQSLGVDRLVFPQQEDYLITENYSNGIKIELLKTSEIDRFIELAHQAVRDEPIPKEYEWTKEKSIRERTRNYYEKALINPKEWTLLVAKDSEEKIVGIFETTVITSANEKIGLSCLLGVCKDNRQQGIATGLYYTYEMILRARKDTSRIIAGVFNTNIPSLNLHEKLGMEKIPMKLSFDKMTTYCKDLR